MHTSGPRAAAVALAARHLYLPPLTTVQKRVLLRLAHRACVSFRHDVLHPESKQQTTPASPRDALECVAALARTRECRQNCVRFAYRGPQVDRLHVLELKRDVE